MYINTYLTPETPKCAYQTDNFLLEWKSYLLRYSQKDDYKDDQTRSLESNSWLITNQRKKKTLEIDKPKSFPLPSFHRNFAELTRY